MQLEITASIEEMKEKMRMEEQKAREKDEMALNGLGPATEKNEQSQNHEHKSVDFHSTRRMFKERTKKRGLGNS